LYFCTRSRARAGLDEAKTSLTDTVAVAGRTASLLAIAKDASHHASQDAAFFRRAPVNLRGKSDALNQDGELLKVSLLGKQQVVAAVYLFEADLLRLEIDFGAHGPGHNPVVLVKGVRFALDLRSRPERSRRLALSFRTHDAFLPSP
jgi:hypothetical protein